MSNTEQQIIKECPIERLDTLPDYINQPRCPFHDLKHENNNPPEVPEIVQLPSIRRAFYALHIIENTEQMLQDIGGSDRIHQLTTRFYAHSEQDFTLSKFLFATDGPAAHGQRLGDWIIEKMGGKGTPYTDSGRDGMRPISHDNAWNSVKREPERIGQRFKCDDCRVWMRLFFWSAREVGLDKHEECFNWLIKLIARFVWIYSKQARKYASIDADWSKDNNHIEQYKNDNYVMHDVLGMGR